MSGTTSYDAQAVKTNWDRLADPANKANVYATAASIASSTVVDPLTLKITLKEPNGQFARDVAFSLPYIASPAALAKHGANYGKEPGTIVGAGPFVVESCNGAAPAPSSRCRQIPLAIPTSRSVTPD